MRAVVPDDSELHSLCVPLTLTYLVLHSVRVQRSNVRLLEHGDAICASALCWPR